MIARDPREIDERIQRRDTIGLFFVFSFFFFVVRAERDVMG